MGRSVATAVLLLAVFTLRSILALDITVMLDAPGKPNPKRPELNDTDGELVPASVKGSSITAMSANEIFHSYTIDPEAMALIQSILALPDDKLFEIPRGIGGYTPGNLPKDPSHRLRLTYDRTSKKFSVAVGMQHDIWKHSRGDFGPTVKWVKVRSVDEIKPFDADKARKAGNPVFSLGTYGEIAASIREISADGKVSFVPTYHIDNPQQDKEGKVEIHEFTVPWRTMVFGVPDSVFAAIRKHNPLDVVTPVYISPDAIARKTPDAEALVIDPFNPNAPLKGIPILTGQMNGQTMDTALKKKIDDLGCRWSHLAKTP